MHPLVPSDSRYMEQKKKKKLHGYYPSLMAVTGRETEGTAAVTDLQPLI